MRASSLRLHNHAFPSHLPRFTAMFDRDRIPEKSTKRVVFLWSLVMGLLFTTAIQAQPADTLLLRGKQILEAGLAQGDMDQLLTARATFERVTADAARAALAHYYIAYTEYQLVNLLRSGSQEDGTDREGEILVRLQSAVEQLEISIERDETSADAHALLSSVYGQIIGARPLMGAVLGLKSGRAINRAKKLDPDNPRVVLIEAISNWNTPRMWGGSPDKAMEGFERAALLFTQEELADPLLPSWGHNETYAWTGIVYMDRGQLRKAREAFEKALEVDPDFGWVRYALLPSLEAQEAAESN